MAAQGLGLAECAELTATMLREHGLDAAVVPGNGFRVVFVEVADVALRQQEVFVPTGTIPGLTSR